MTHFEKYALFISKLLISELGEYKISLLLGLNLQEDKLFV